MYLTQIHAYICTFVMCSLVQHSSSQNVIDYLSQCIGLLVYSGTDATHAEHIETIKSRLYVGVRPDGKFVPGELGMGLVEG